MKYSQQIHSYGCIKTAVKQGEMERPKNPAEIEQKQKIADICLNCPYKTCVVNCRRFAQKKREIQDG